MIGMPLGFDQPDNLAFLVDRGAAEALSPWADVNETVRTIKTVIGQSPFLILIELFLKRCRFRTFFST